MVVAAEGARAGAALTAGFSVSSGSSGVSLERPVRCAGTVVNPATAADVPVGRPAPCFGARTQSAAGAVNPAVSASASVKIVPVVKRGAPGVVPVVVINCVTVMPIESPMRPAPSKTAEEAGPEPDSEREVRAAIPDSGIRVPPRPRHYGTSVNQPRIIRGDVNDIGTSRLNDGRRALRRYGLLRRGLKIAGFLRSPAHHLYGIHHILLLVVVGVA